MIQTSSWNSSVWAPPFSTSLETLVLSFTDVVWFFSYVTLVICQYGDLLSVRNRRVSMVHSNPLWGPRRNLVVPFSMAATALIAVINLYGPGLQNVFYTRPIPGMFWGIPFAFALGILLMDELRKLIVRTYPKVRYLVRVVALVG